MIYAYEIVGYVYDGDIYCADCLPISLSNYEETEPIYADGDLADECCSACGGELL